MANGSPPRQMEGQTEVAGARGKESHREGVPPVPEGNSLVPTDEASPGTRSAKATLSGMQRHNADIGSLCNKKKTPSFFLLSCHKAPCGACVVQMTARRRTPQKQDARRLVHWKGVTGCALHSAGPRRPKKRASRRTALRTSSGSIRDVPLPLRWSSSRGKWVGHRARPWPRGPGPGGSRSTNTGPPLSLPRHPVGAVRCAHGTAPRAAHSTPIRWLSPSGPSAQAPFFFEAGECFPPPKRGLLR